MDINSGSQASTDTDECTFVNARRLTPEQLAVLGVSHIAYVKRVTVDGMQGYAIHAADGTPLAVTDDFEVAIATILQHEMHPLSVH